MRSLTLVLLAGLAVACVPKTGSTEDVIVVENPNISYEPIIDEAALAAEKAEAEAAKAAELARLLDEAPEVGVFVRVTDPGAAEAPVALRYAPEVGFTEAAQVTSDLNIDMQVGGNDIPVRVPVIVVDLKVEVTEVSEEGQITFATSITGVEVQDKEGAQEGLAAQLQAQLDSLVGVSEDMIITTSGDPVHLSFSAPEGASADVIGQLQTINEATQRLVAPLPEEAVGQGATWQVFRRTTFNGIGVVELDRVTLTELTEAGASLDYEVENHLASGTVEIPGLPPGTSVTVNSFESAGSGSSTLSLGGVSVDSGDSQVVMDLAVTFDAGGGPQDLNMKMDLGVGNARPAAE